MAQSTESLHVVVLSCGDAGAEVARELERIPQVRRVTLVTAPYTRKRPSLARRIRNVYRYQGVRGFAVTIAKRLRTAARRGRDGADSSPALPPSIRHLHFPDLHGEECLRAVRELAPDLGVVVGTYVLQESLFAIPRLGSINLHSGKVPEYRGSAPAFWELYNGESHVGITIHTVTSALDAGDVLLEREFPIERVPLGDPMTYLERFRASVLRPNGVAMLLETVGRIAEGRAEPRAQDGSRAKTYPRPTHAAVRALRRRIRARQHGLDSIWKRRLKTLIGQIVFRARLAPLFLRRKAVVVLFHRVDDRYRGDPITCDTRQFAAFCDFFRRYFTVVGLGELLDRLESGRDVGGRLVITFDDGYLDNHRIAAPELSRRRLPACFFIATGFIGTEQNTWWDEMRGVRSEWMSWSDVRELHAQGFEIGAHTVTHPDLGVVSGAEARLEIVGSKTRLEQELGAGVDLFCYPFGRREQITEENRRAVRDAGFRCCLSAYGGAVAPGADPFDLKRVGINSWHLSPYQFGFETLMTRP